MQFIKDRFIASVVIITAVIILGMFVVHKLRESRSRSDTATKSGQSSTAENKTIPFPHSTQPLPPKGSLRVTHVIDGDTIVLDNGDTVRLIGVDAREIHHSEIPVQRFGQESAEFLRRFAEGFECTLEYESGNLRDKYGRLLAYVFIGDRLANAEIIRRGYGYAYTRFPFSRQAEFISLEREARESQSGLWSLSPRDGRIANLVKRYDSLNMEGRKKLDEILKELARKYPALRFSQ